MKGYAVKYLSVVTCTLLAILATVAQATCTQDLSYRGNGVELGVMENFGSERPLLELIAEAEAALPMLYGWELARVAPSERHAFHFACGQHNLASYWRNGEKVLERSCSGQGIAATLSEMLVGLGWSGDAIDRMRGYTVQLAYLPQGIGWEGELSRWNDYLLSHEGGETAEAIDVRGDCVQQSLWLHHYPGGGTAIRFGIFRGYRDALAAVERLGLPANHAQVLPQRFNLTRLRDYIQHAQ